MVEYAFAFPVLLLAVVAALTILWAAFVQVAATHAAREGARYASVALPPTYRAHPDAAAVVERVRSRVGVLGLSNEDVVVTPSTSSNAPVVVTVSKSLPSPLRPFARLFTGSDTVVATSEGKARTE